MFLPHVAFETFVICTAMVLMCSSSPLPSASSSATLQLLPPDPHFTVMYRAPPSYDFPRRHQVSHKSGLIIVAKQPQHPLHPLSSSSSLLSSRLKPKFPHKTTTTTTTTPKYPIFSGQWHIVTPEAPPPGFFETQVVYNEDGTRIVDLNPPSSTSTEETTTLETTTTTMMMTTSAPEVTSLTEDNSATPLQATETATTISTPVTTTTPKIVPTTAVLPPKTGTGSLLGKLGGGWLTSLLGNLFMSGRESEPPPMTSQMAMNRFGRPLEEEKGMLRGTNFPFRASMEGWRPMNVDDSNNPTSFYSPPDQWKSDPEVSSENPMEHLRIDNGQHQEPGSEPQEEMDMEIATNDYEDGDGQPTPDPQLLSWFLMARKPPMNPTEILVPETEVTSSPLSSPPFSSPSSLPPPSSTSSLKPSLAPLSESTSALPSSASTFSPSTSLPSSPSPPSSSSLPSSASEFTGDVTTASWQSHTSNGVSLLGNIVGPTEALWVISEKLPKGPRGSETTSTTSTTPFTASTVISAGPVADSYERKRGPLEEHLTKMHKDLSSHLSSLFPFLAPLSHVKLQL